MDFLNELLLAFLMGGIVCIPAQILIDKTKLTPARILVIYVSLGVLLYALGIYDPLFKIFSTGVSVPLIGFGANIAKGVKQAVEAEGLIGALSGGLTAASAGIAAALIFGLIISFFFKSKPKRM